MDLLEFDHTLSERFDSLGDFGGYHQGSDRYQECSARDLTSLQRVVRYASERSIPIRARGNGHSMNGLALPREGEILINSDRIRHYRFDTEGTVTVGAGACVWDLDKLLGRYGFELLVCNDGGAAAATVGGFISAGGIGLTTWMYGGFWETVDQVTMVTVDGQVISYSTTDLIFPWLFGSMGQLGILFEARLRIRSLDGHSSEYPMGETGEIDASIFPWRKYIWLTLFVPEAEWRNAQSSLGKLEAKHSEIWRSKESYMYFIRFMNFNPPLLYPKQENFVAVGIWGEPSDAEGFDMRKVRDLERDFSQLLDDNPEYRRYVQSEMIFEDFSYERYFGTEVYRNFVRFKEEMDPRMLLSQGLLA